MLKTEIFQQHFGNRRQAVGGARGVGDDMVLTGIILVGVDPHDNGDIRITGRRRYDNFAGTGCEMFGGALSIPQYSGRFGHNIHSKIAPTNFFRVFHGPDRYGFAIDFDAVFPGGNFLI